LTTVDLSIKAMNVDHRNLVFDAAVGLVSCILK